MRNRLIIGQYHPLDSFGHNLDTRFKIAAVAVIMVLSVFTVSAWFYLGIIAGLIVLLLMSRISTGSIVSNLKPFLILVSITAIYHLIFSARDSRTLVEIWGLRLTAGGVDMAISFSLRVLVFVFLAFFISLTTLPTDMAESLVRGLRPLKRFGVPVDDLALIIFIAMRLIPVLIEELDTIRKAQIVRGVSFSGGLFIRARKLLYLVIPVFQASLRRADDLALAIEARGYVSGAERSSYRIFRATPRDWLFLIISIIITGMLFWILG